MQLSNDSALIIIDMQNGFCDPEGFMEQIGLGTAACRAVIPAVDRLATAARSAGLPVFYTRYTVNADYSDAGLLLEVLPQIEGTGGMVRDTWDADIVDQLTPHEGDRVLDKTRYSAFVGTDLQEQLAQLGIDTLIICGVTSNVCVESTARDAFFRDIRVVVPSDATAAVTPEMHESALQNFEYSFGLVVTVDELTEAMAQLAAA